MSTRPTSARPDALVIGAGIVGAACARELSRAGLRVELLDPGTPGGGATAAGMGHLVVIDEPAGEFALSHDSLKRWQELSAELPARSEYSACGTLWIASDEAEWAEAQAKAGRLAAAGIQAELLDAPELSRAQPGLRGGLRGGLLVPFDAVVYAPHVTHWMLRSLPAVQRTRVVRIDGRHVTLEDGSSREAGCVVIAAGLESRALAPELPLRARKGHLVITDRHPGLVKHQLVELGYIKNAHGTAQESIAFNVQPRPNGQLLIGSSRQFDDESRTIDERMLARIVTHAIDYLPSLQATSAIRAWTGLRAATPDGQPIIGGHRGHPGLYAACGHEGLGITTALSTAALIRAAVCGSAPPIDPKPYSWERFDA